MGRGKSYLPYFAGVLVAVIFGFSFMFTKNSLDIMGPFQLLAFRFTAAAGLLTILKILGIIKVDYKGKSVGGLIILTVAQPIAYFICETTGVNLTSSSEAGMMIALIPVAVTIFASFILKEKPTLMQAVSILVSVSGVVVIIAGKGFSNDSPNYMGLLLLFGAVLSAVAYNTLSRKMSVAFNPVEITYVMMWVGAVTFNIIAVIQKTINGEIGSYFAPLANMDSWIPILYLGILSSVGAFFMMNFMLSKIPATQASVFNNLTTVVSILAGVFIKNEPFYWFHVLGGAMILVGVFGTNYYSTKVNDVKADAVTETA